MKPKEELKQIKELLHDDLYTGSKDWLAADTIGRIQWLIAMYEGKAQEVNMWIENMCILNDKLKGIETNLQRIEKYESNS